MNSSKLFQKFLLLGLILIMVMASGCGGGIEEIEPGSNTPPIASGPDYPCPQPGRSLGISGEKSNGYVAGQIVFTGIPEDIYFVVTEFKYSEEPFENPFKNPGEPIATIDLPLVGDDSLDLDIRLFDLKPGYDVWDTVLQINNFIFTIFEENNLQLVVFAEPNYITGDCPGCSGGIGGDPCPGCSGGIGGDPATAASAAEAAKDALAYAQEEFLNQWAFGGRSENNGDIGLYDELFNWTANNNAGQNYTGNKIEIAVFDTVPSDFNEGHINVFWASVPFDLCVWKPGLMIAPDVNSQISNNEENIDTQDHGLFVTGLSQGVAPGARYFLIEALNAEAQGDVISLLFGMNEYANFRRMNNISENLNNTVINLSLGLELENNPTIAEAGAQFTLEKLQEVLDQTYWVYSEDLRNQPYPSVALKIALTVYEQEGAMIVAAAGNDFKNPTQIPAGFSNVLGVSSNSIKPDLSCFSNYGDVAAPGGDGKGRDCDLNLVNLCAEYSGNIGDCPFTVISLISRNPVQSEGGALNPGFGYWAGTSMSTPIVSGLAVLIFEKCAGITPAGIRGMIETAAFPPASLPSGLGVGVINVENTLALTCPSSP